MLTERQHEQQRKRLSRLLRPWVKRLGLHDWEAKVIVSKDALGTPTLGSQISSVLACCYPSWMYKSTYIEFSGPSLLNLDDDDLERAIVHELFHCKVDEMSKNDGIPDPHEERVVTELTDAAIWTYDAGYEDGRKAALREMKKKAADG